VRPFLWPALAVALTLGLRAPFLDVPLTLDEGGLAFVASHWDEPGAYLYGPYWVDRPPLLVGLFALAVTGGADGIRVLGAVAAVALVLIAYGIGRELRGRDGALVAALATAAMASAWGIASVYTPAELPAAAFAGGSVLCLLRERYAAAGALALCAVLVKQSFLDAAAAGGLVVLVLALRRREVRPVAAYAAGVAAVLAALALWLAIAGRSVDELTYAMFGFRIDAVPVLTEDAASLADKLSAFVRPGLRAGVPLALAVAAVGLWRMRRDGMRTVVLGAWLTVGLVGILAGGSYWPHYWIQLVLPASALMAAALVPARAWLRWGAVGALVALVAVVDVRNARRIDRFEAGSPAVAVADYVRERAEPGDTLHVLYAQASVYHYAELDSPYPYFWSLMLRAIPGARDQLAQLLASPERPTWIVRWQRLTRWSLDDDGAIAAALERYYEPVATVCGRRIYRRS
jgi:4-amino-4-deoxy-L-arabinose transferase-like glycosyltransferase